MPIKEESCEHNDFSPCSLDNPEQPVCEIGHGWSSDCLHKNNCQDYCPTEGLSLEEVKTMYNIKKRYFLRGDDYIDRHNRKFDNREGRR